MENYKLYIIRKPLTITNRKQLCCVSGGIKSAAATTSAYSFSLSRFQCFKVIMFQSMCECSGDLTDRKSHSEYDKQKYHLDKELYMHMWLVTAYSGACFILISLTVQLNKHWSKVYMYRVRGLH